MTMFGRRREKGREGGLSYAEFLNLYGGLLDDLEPLVLEIAKAGITLGSGHLKDLESEVNVEFAGRVAAFRQKIEDTVEQTHKGGFDGNVKRIVAETYGPNSDVAQKYGDQEENALCLILPGQAKKVSAVKLVAEFLGVQTPPATKTAVAKLLEAARVKVNVAESERKQSRETTKPTRAEGEKQSDYLKRLAAHNAAGKGASSEFGEVKGAIKWLSNWVEGKKPGTRTDGQQDAGGTKPPKDKKTELKEKIEELEGKKTSHQAAAQTALANGNTAAAMASVKQMEEVESELTAAKAELEAIKTGEQEKSRLATAATIEAQAPPMPGEVTGTMPGAVHMAPEQRKDDGPMTLEEVVAEIARLEKEFTDTMAAADRHYADAAKLNEEADNLRKDGKRKEAATKDLEAASFEVFGAKTKKAAEGIQTRLEAKKAELEAAAKPQTATQAAETAPATVTKPKRVRLAGRKSTTEPAAAQATAAQAAVTPDGAKPETDKITLIKAVKAAKETIGAEVTEALIARIVNLKDGDTLEAVKEDFDIIVA